MPSTILAVDDSATMRKALEITFAGTDFRLLTCDNANTAVEKVKTERPDLVIADVSLPPSDGYALCNTVKLASPGLPVLMLSSRHNPFDPSKGAQADDHIDKPFDTQTLIDKARTLIEAGVAKVAAAAAPARVAAAPPMMETMHGVGEAAPPPGPAAAGQPPTPQAPPAISQPSPIVGRRAEASDARRRAPMKTMRFDPAVTPAAPGPQVGGDRAKLMKTLAFPAKQGPAGAADEPLELREEPLPEPPPPGRPAKKPAARKTVPSWPAPSPDEKAEPGKKPATPPPLPVDDDEEVTPKPRKAVVPPVEPAAPKPAAAAALAPPELSKRLEDMGLTPEQVSGVLAISRELLEQVIWEVVPTLAETLIKEEIARLTKE